jgi:serine phosphatase RsbU (regulator of sigma subunit)
VNVPAGLPLGIGDDFSETTVAWKPGDRLLLYTDGLSEARNADGEFLPLLEAAAPLGSGALEDALTRLLDDVRRHVPRGALGDDLAVVMLEHSPAAPVSDKQPSRQEPARESTASSPAPST